jgi:hypothetical protein
MNDRTRHTDNGGWGLWVVLLAITALASLWVNDGAHRDRVEPWTPRYSDPVVAVPRDDPPIAPRIVFPGEDDDRGGDDLPVLEGE